MRGRILTYGLVLKQPACRAPQLAGVGMGAQVIQCLTIGEGATIGAGAVVIEDVPAHATAVGVPARVIKWGAPAGNETASAGV